MGVVSPGGPAHRVRSQQGPLVWPVFHSGAWKDGQWPSDGARGVTAGAVCQQLPTVTQVNGPGRVDRSDSWGSHPVSVPVPRGRSGAPQSSCLGGSSAGPNQTFFQIPT